MTKEEAILLKDLCARVPYHPKGHVVNACNGAECDEWLTCATFTMFTNVTNNCRLYLRPISSMTEEEKEELKEISRNYLDEWEHTKTSLERWKLDAKESYLRFVFYNSHHFDWNGLIEKNLALDCTGLHIYD